MVSVAPAATLEWDGLVSTYATMKDDRLRVPVDTAYVAAIGLAAYCFTRLEWAAVNCGEKISPGYIHTVGGQTAGQIACSLLGVASRMAEGDKRDRMKGAAVVFKKLVDERNGLMHSIPATIDGEQRLTRDHAALTPDIINDMADSFSACEFEMGDLYYNVL